VKKPVLSDGIFKEFAVLPTQLFLANRAFQNFSYRAVFHTIFFKAKFQNFEYEVHQAGPNPKDPDGQKVLLCS
jgi:hypothetical protein